LRAENAWTKSAFGRWGGLEAELLAEFRSRVVPRTTTVPVRDGPFLYYWRYLKGEEYPALLRKKPVKGARGKVLLDGNQLANKAHGGRAEGYFRLGFAEPSPDHRLLAFAADTVGRRLYTIRFRNLDSGRFLRDEIPNAAANLVWASTGDAVLYAVPDPGTLRWSRVVLHRLGSSAPDSLMYEEEDDTFWLSLRRSRSRELILFHLSRTDESEVRSIPAAAPETPPRTLLPRGERHECDLDHFRGRFYIRSNRSAPDFRLVEAAETDPASGWKDIVPPRRGIHLEDFLLFDDHLVLFERQKGRQELSIRRYDEEEPRTSRFGASEASSCRDQRPPLASAAAARSCLCFRRSSRNASICTLSASGTMNVGMFVCWLRSLNV